MPDAGALTNRVRFDTRGADANGDPLGPWAEGPTVWAQLIWLRGSEAVLQQRLEGQQPVAIVVRESSQTRALTPASRAVLTATGEVLNITAVSPSKQPGFLDVLAVRGGAAG